MTPAIETDQMSVALTVVMVYWGVISLCVGESDPMKWSPLWTIIGCGIFIGVLGAGS